MTSPGKQWHCVLLTFQPGLQHQPPAQRKKTGRNPVSPTSSMCSCSGDTCPATRLPQRRARVQKEGAASPTLNFCKSIITTQPQNSLFSTDYTTSPSYREFLQLTPVFSCVSFLLILPQPPGTMILTQILTLSFDTSFAILILLQLTLLSHILCCNCPLLFSL